MVRAALWILPLALLAAAARLPGGLLPLTRGSGAAAADSSLTVLEVRLAAMEQELGNLRSLEATASHLAQVEDHVLALRQLQARLEAAVLSLAAGVGASRADAATLRDDLRLARASEAALAADLVRLEEEFQRREAAAGQARSLEAEREKLRADILAPTFQLCGEEAVGSAVLLRRESDAAGPHYVALTSYHVVRDILNERGAVADLHGERLDALVDRDGRRLRLQARLVAEDPANDLALVRLDTAENLGPPARLAPLARLQKIEEFTPVYTVGCPLGTAAQATRGEITRCGWELAGQQFWMVSSPAFYGNSGGGVFLEETHELVALFAKIYTHGSFRPQVVTHMGLAVPLDVLHGWLRSVGHGDLLPQEPAVADAPPGDGASAVAAAVASGR